MHLLVERGEPIDTQGHCKICLRTAFRGERSEVGRGVDLLHHFRHRGCPAVLSDVAYLGLDCFASLLLRSDRRDAGLESAPHVTCVELNK